MGRLNCCVKFAINDCGEKVDMLVGFCVVVDVSSGLPVASMTLAVVVCRGLLVEVVTVVELGDVERDLRLV